MNIDIDKLEQKASEVSGWSGCTVLELVAEVRRLRAELAAAQAREKLLRETLEAVQGIADQSDGIVGWHRNGDVATWASLLPEVPNAIVLPSDDTALRQALKAAKEEMRERAAIAGARIMEEMGVRAGGKIFADGQVIADAIRALEVE